MGIFSILLVLLLGLAIWALDAFLFAMLLRLSLACWQWAGTWNVRVALQSLTDPALWAAERLLSHYLRRPVPVWATRMAICLLALMVRYSLVAWLTSLI